MEECLDGATWKSRYANLLRGLSHAQTLRFHEAFVKAYKGRASYLRSSSMESIEEALSRLHNCHEIILSDEYDLETTCSDWYLRGKIQKSVELLYRPLLWSLSPRMWKETPESREALFACPEVFWALQSCPSVTNMTIDFWAAHSILITELLPPYCANRKRHDSKYHNVTRLTLALKFCPAEWLDAGYPSTQRALSDLLACTMSFPVVEELNIKPSFVDPGNEYMQHCLEQQRNDDSDDNDEYYSGNWSDDAELLNMFARPDCSATLLTALHADRYGWTETVYKTKSAELCPEFVHIRRLRFLRLFNLTMDSRILLCWLCSQSQVPASALTLELHGKVIFFGLEKNFVRRALASLNVQIRYAADDNVCCFPELHDWPEIPHLAVGATKGKSEVQERYWIHDEWPPWAFADTMVINLEEHSLPAIPPHDVADVVSRANDFEQLIAKHQKSERDMSYYIYEARLINDRVVWDWIDGITHDGVSDLNAAGSKTRGAVPLLRATIQRYCPYDDGYGDYEYQNMLEREAQAHAEMQDLQEQEQQHLLMMYETELCAFDLVGDDAETDETTPNYNSATISGTSYK